jgi:putative AbiEi antitoxin of type IV toxin-antitoxin system
MGPSVGQVLEHLADNEGIILRRDANALGYDDNYLARARRRGDIVRLRQGAYVLTRIWEQADRVGRHLLLVHAVVKLYDDRVAVSHQSACVAQGGPNWGLDLSTVHLTNLFGIGERRGASITHHRGTCRVVDVSRDGAGWITSPVRSALDTAALAGRDPAVSVLDWYLNQGLVSEEALRIGLAAKSEWADTLALFTKVQLCDGRSESVGESRSRLLCVDRRLPTPSSSSRFSTQVVDSRGAPTSPGPNTACWASSTASRSTDAPDVPERRSNRPSSARRLAKICSASSRAGPSSDSPGPTLERPAATEARIRRALARAAA